MKSKIYAAVLASCTLLQGCNSDSNNHSDSTEDADAVSYAIGFNIGSALAKQDSSISLKGIITGMKDGFSETDNPKFSQEEMQQAVTDYSKNKQAEMIEQRSASAKTNEQEGKAFLEANKSNSDIKTLDSGLQYKIVKEGDGPIPTVDDTVIVEYTGKFIDGKVFSSSSERGMPATFKVSQVIPAWTEALQIMPKGSVWELYVPSSLAYGEQGASDVIGPNQTLIFTVDLIDVKKDEENKTEE